MADALAVTNHEIDIAARTLVGEARGEPDEGKAAVAWVIRNRATWDPPAWWGNSLEAVCLHKYQFSCWLASDPNSPMIATMKTTDPRYQDALAVVTGVMDGSIDDPTAGIGGGTHYKVIGTKASWDASTEGKPSVKIGHHEFWRLGPSG